MGEENVRVREGRGRGKKEDGRGESREVVASQRRYRSEEGTVDWLLSLHLLTFPSLP